MRVRRAAAADFGSVTSLLEELGRATVSAESREACQAIWERHLGDERAAHLVAEDDEGAIVGFCSLHFRDRLNYPSPDAWVPDLIVTESARRRGVARALLAEAERLARERGCWQLTLESGYQREEAHQLYRALEMIDHGKYFTKPL